ncbi:MAG: hypothetical protein H0V07_00390 [Propionibacteriales bacterium]|nr:hypothetical protein [Propionibacteriales bacterium]
MNQRMRIGVAAAAVILGGGVTWSAFGASQASTTDHHGWPTSSSQSAAEVVHAAQASAQDPESQVLTVVEQEVASVFIDVGAAGESPGDYFVARGRLWNRSQTMVVGRDAVHCTLGVRAFICDATARISGKGKIAVYGAFFSEDDARIPVIGGTDAYRDVGGQLTIANQSDGTTLLVFQLTRD